eukprot:TRINITY_DN7322_c0_g1_i1.p1 TRINITY_DN7322_c0_g1~~TRINITY_DN7322_c0_g1_i1.p1  ORF type:complete len:190 (-),score=42.75 TRINITY_DN7322_c0_g1_i1:100-669(-)
MEVVRSCTCGVCNAFDLPICVMHFSDDETASDLIEDLEDEEEEDLDDDNDDEMVGSDGDEQDYYFIMKNATLHMCKLELKKVLEMECTLKKEVCLLRLEANYFRKQFKFKRWAYYNLKDSRPSRLQVDQANRLYLQKAMDCMRKEAALTRVSTLGMRWKIRLIELLDFYMNSLSRVKYGEDLSSDFDFL